MKYITLIVVSLFSIYSCSQDIPVSKVPSVVVNTVQAKFGNAGQVVWEKKNKLYEAEFKMDSIEYAVYVDPAGKLIMQKMDIQENELPAAVSEVIRTGYAGYGIDDVAKIERDGISYYEVELEAKGKKDLELVFSSDGKLATEMNYFK